MKLKTFIPALLVSCLMLSLPHIVARDDDDDDGHDGGSSNEECDIDGSETLRAKVFLMPTEFAPPDAKGCAKLRAEIQDGIVTAELKIKTKGLNPGDYAFSAVRTSDGSLVVLGQITIAVPEGDCEKDARRHDDDDDDDDDGDDDEDDEDDNSGHDGHHDDDDDDDDGDNSGPGHDGEDGHHDDDDDDKLTSETEVPLPAELDPMDIAQIIVSDAEGNPVLVGDLLQPCSKTTLKFNAHVELTCGEAAPEAEGKAHVVSSAKKGKEKNRFTLIASGVPANSTFDVHVDGTHVQTVKSNRKGKVLVKKLPANLMGVRSVQLLDAQGGAVVSARF